MAKVQLTPIRQVIRSLQQEIDDNEWEGLAPEKMQHQLHELAYLQDRESKGDTHVPNF